MAYEDADRFLADYFQALEASHRQARAKGAKDWESAAPGDMLLSGGFLVRRRIRTKRVAEELAAMGCDRKVILDGRYFAVVAINSRQREGQMNTHRQQRGASDAS